MRRRLTAMSAAAPAAAADGGSSPPPPSPTSPTPGWSAAAAGDPPPVATGEAGGAPAEQTVPETPQSGPGVDPQAPPKADDGEFDPSAWQDPTVTHLHVLEKLLAKLVDAATGAAAPHADGKSKRKALSAVKIPEFQGGTAVSVKEYRDFKQIVEVD